MAYKLPAQRRNCPLSAGLIGWKINKRGFYHDAGPHRERRLQYSDKFLSTLGCSGGLHLRRLCRHNYCSVARLRPHTENETDYVETELGRSLRNRNPPCFVAQNDCCCCCMKSADRFLVLKSIMPVPHTTSRLQTSTNSMWCKYTSAALPLRCPTGWAMPDDNGFDSVAVEVRENERV